MNLSRSLLSPFSILLILFTMGCSDDLSLENNTQIIDETSILNIGNGSVEKKVTYRVIQENGVETKREVVGVSIDGKELIQSLDNTWQYSDKKPLDSSVPTPVKSEIPAIAPEECETEVTCRTILPITTNPINGLPQSVRFTESTCFSVTNENGVMVTTVTYSRSSSLYWGHCNQ